MKRLCESLIVVLTCAIRLSGQANAPALPSDSLTIMDQVDRIYPSLEPLHELKVASNDPNIMLPAESGGYQVSVNNKVTNAISALRVSKNGQTGQPDLSVVYLVLRPGIKKGDKLRVSIQAGKSNEIAAAESPNISFSLTPAFIQSEALVTGTKRPVGQLHVAFDELTLTNGTPFRTHLTTNSTISTDAKDTKSDVNILYGLEWSLIRSWYLPFHADTKVIGDQVIDNLSSVSSVGFTTIVPWLWTKGLLNNRVLDSPVSPLLTFDAQFERRVRQDAAALKIYSDKNAFRLHGQAAWTPIRFLKGTGGGDYISLQVGGQGWYIPHQHTSANILKDRLEGALQTSVLIPVSKLTLSGAGLTTAQKGTKSQIQIQYLRGANEAKGFRHSAQLSIGVLVNPSQ